MEDYVDIGTCKIELNWIDCTYISLGSLVILSQMVRARGIKSQHFHQGWQKIHGAGGHGQDRAWLDFLGPPYDSGNSNASLVCSHILST